MARANNKATIKTLQNFWSKPKPWMVMSVLLAAYVLFNQRYQVDVTISPRTGTSRSMPANTTGSSSTSEGNTDLFKSLVFSPEGVELPIQWGDLGKQMVDAGVIDADKFRQLFGGQLPDTQETMLTGTWDQSIRITQENSRFLLDLFWALGLGNKNPILTEGEMSNEQYGGAGNFASTGGWTLAKGDAMTHYSAHSFIALTPEQQALVEETSRNIYRPCCGNSTHFPDCNHGMAMLGLLELMASQGATEQQMYDAALAVNSIWFPQTYQDLAMYFNEQGQDWDQVDAKLALSQEYSSGQGYAETRKKIKRLPTPAQGGGGCGV